MDARCAVDDQGCRGEVPVDAPVRLCAEHLARAAEWGTERDGAADVLAWPCVLCGSRMGLRLPSGWLCAVCEWRVGEPVDDDIAPPRIDVVYYLGFEDRIKIGTTANPRQRFAALRHDGVRAFERGARRLERRRHEQFASCRLGSGEWFAADPALLAHIEEVRAGCDPWDVYARWRSESRARLQ